MAEKTPMEAEMTAAAAGRGLKKAMMIEAAKKELEMLDAQQPNKFNHLKMEINHFILSLMDEEQVQHPLNIPPGSNISISSPAKTQASSTCWKKKRKNNNTCEKLQRLIMLPIVICLPSQLDDKEETEIGTVTGAEEGGFVIAAAAANNNHKISKKVDSCSATGGSGCGSAYNERKEDSSSIDEVIKRAQACLDKIQHFKTNFYS